MKGLRISSSVETGIKAAEKRDAEAQPGEVYRPARRVTPQALFEEDETELERPNVTGEVKGHGAKGEHPWKDLLMATGIALGLLFLVALIVTVIT